MVIFDVRDVVQVESVDFDTILVRSNERSGCVSLVCARRDPLFVLRPEQLVQMSARSVVGHVTKEPNIDA